VVALEIDGAHAGLAARAGRWPNVAVELADGRTYPYERLRAAHPVRGRILVAGNLPYSASKPILLRLWDSRGGLDAATLMLQREVAERLVAAPGGKAYGALSVLLAGVGRPQPALRRAAGAFRPPPAVESAVVCGLRASPRVPIADPAAFARQGGCSAPEDARERASRGLRRLGAPGEPPLAGAGIDGRRRAEVSLPEFARLAQFFAGPEVA
jgi:16S rRNA (adenine1518-N6/adenine1519-N6)-dimethyltransferase